MWITKKSNIISEYLYWKSYINKKYYFKFNKGMKKYRVIYKNRISTITFSPISA